MTRVTGDWIENPATQKVCAVLASEGAQVLFVGGCVRNSLLGEPVSDIDIATESDPNTVIRLAEAAGIRAIPTGIDHGTVTLVIDGLPHEVTTFRKDVETDGRRAVIAFSTRVEDDAARRDFTMNAIYAHADGTILDPLGGLSDLRARRVRFIGDATDRIREDYLRSLRFFRFHAWYGDQAAGFDPDAMAAIADNLDGLGTLSRERVGSELLKLLGAPDPAPSVAAMRSTGALGVVLPGADDKALGPLVHLEKAAGKDPDPIRRLVVLGGTDLAERLRLSREQARRIENLRHAIGSDMSPEELGYRLKERIATDAALIRNAILVQPWDDATLARIRKGAEAKFPLKAKDLMPGLEGPALGRKLADLESEWIRSGFALTRDQLLNSGL